MKKLWRLLTHPFIASTLGLVGLICTLYGLCVYFRAINPDLITLIIGGPLVLLHISYWLRRYGEPWWLNRVLKKQNEQPHTDVRAVKAGARAFDDALRSLTQRCRERGLIGGAAELPWVVVLGESRSGKSTVLEQSGLRFLPLGRGIQGHAIVRSCRWWLSMEAVLLEAVSRSAAQAEEHGEWRTFLSLLRQRRRLPLNAAVAVVSIESLIEQSRTQIEVAASDLRERLEELRHELAVDVPVYLIFNGCDRIAGFIEYFDELPVSEREQPLGFNLNPGSLSDEELVTVFQTRFDEISDRITEHSTLRILRLESADSREAALHFSREWRQWRERLTSFVAALCSADPEGRRPRLTAVYWSSAEPQPGSQSSSFLQRREKSTITLVPSRTKKQARAASGATVEPLFVRGIFPQLLVNAEQVVRPTAERLSQLRQRRALAFAVGTLACLLLSLAIEARFRRDFAWLKQVEIIALSVKSSTPSTHRDPLADADALRKELYEDKELLSATINSPRSIPEEFIGILHDLLATRIETKFIAPLVHDIQKDFTRLSSYHNPSNNQRPSPELLQAVLSDLKLMYILSGMPCLDEEEMVDEAVELIQNKGQSKLGSRFPLAAGVPPKEMSDLSEILRFYVNERRNERQSKASVDKLFSVKKETQITAREQLEKNDAPLLLKLSALPRLSEQPAFFSASFLVAPHPIARAFTAAGCAEFYASDDRALALEEWQQCVLSGSMTAASLESTYVEYYQKAWLDWYQKLSLSDHYIKVLEGQNITEQLSTIHDALFELTNEQQPALDELFRVLGKGIEPADYTAKKKYPSRLKAVEKAKQAWNWTYTKFIKMNPPEFCQRARHGFLVFEQLRTGQVDETLEGNPTPLESNQAKARKEAFDAYLKAARTLNAHLERLQTMSETERAAAAAAMVQGAQASAGLLVQLTESRYKLIEHLKTGTTVDIATNGIFPILERLERDLYRTLARLTREEVQRRWQTTIIPAVLPLSYHGPRGTVKEETKKCQDFVAVLKEKVIPFIDTYIAPYYRGRNLDTCEVDYSLYAKSHPLQIPPETCKKLHEVILVSQTDCSRVAGKLGTLALVPPASIDMLPTKPSRPEDRIGCNFSLNNILIDTGEKVYRCEPQEKCIDTTAKSSGRARIQLHWQDDPNLSIERIPFEADEYEKLLAQASQQLSTWFIFNLPRTGVNGLPVVPGNCDNFRLRLDVLIPPHAESASKADINWQRTDLLPEDLLLTPVPQVGQ